MRVFIRLIPVVVAMFVLLGHEELLLADNSCLGCSSNSPTVNPFPIRTLRWGTSRVRQGTPACQIKEADHASIAISKLAPSGNGHVRGYQLIVVNGAHTPICQGAELAGVIFDLTNGRQPVIIQQVAKTAITQDPFHRNQIQDDEYRLLYYIAEITHPHDSLCTHALHSNRLTRLVDKILHRTVTNKSIKAPLPQSSQALEDLPDIFPDQLLEYAVIMPNAEYEDDGEPQTIFLTNLPSIAQASKKDNNGVSLEWFEYACLGGALAHTDLSGLVGIGEPQKYRTAALRMFMARYYSDQSETFEGVPIQYTRDIPYLDENSARTPTSNRLSIKGPIEAKWNEQGATCISHSRLWMKGNIVIGTKYDKHLSPTENEAEFIRQLGSPQLPPCDDKHSGYFTSYALNHIDGTPPPPTSP